MLSHKQHVFNIDRPRVLDEDKLNLQVLFMQLNFLMTFKRGAAGG